MSQVNYTNINGLDLIKKASGTSVSSINIDNCFSEKYSQYKIITNITSASATSYIMTRLRAGGTTESTSVYNTQYLYSSSSASAARNTADTYFIQLNYNVASSSGVTLTEILNPYQSKVTTGYSLRADRPETASIELVHYVAGTDNANSYDGISVLPTTGTITGTVYIYGYVES